MLDLSIFPAAESIWPGKRVKCAKSERQAKDWKRMTDVSRTYGREGQRNDDELTRTRKQKERNERNESDDKETKHR